MRSFYAALIVGAALVSSSPAFAWWDEGHMQIAAVAYSQLLQPAKDRADALLKLNADYPKWTAGAPDPATAKQWAFVHAATWPDDIKTKAYNYSRDDPASATAGQNIGYSDHNQHDYWHYKDIGFSSDGTPLIPPNSVDAVTQLKLILAALPAASGVTDDVRSYDLAWLLHLVGDVHQPLHAVTRFSRELPSGDRGGNSEMVIPATGETINLHAYWDRIFGGYTSPSGAIFDAGGQDGIKAIDPNPAETAIADPEIWVEESAAIARAYAYAAPVGAGANAVMLTREYETTARNVARTQAALAAARLANVLNSAFK